MDDNIYKLKYFTYCKKKKCYHFKFKNKTYILIYSSYLKRYSLHIYTNKEYINDMDNEMLSALKDYIDNNVSDYIINHIMELIQNMKYDMFMDMMKDIYLTTDNEYTGYINLI